MIFNLGSKSIVVYSSDFILCKHSISSSPDEIIDDAPGYCTSCGEPLEDAERILDYVTQVVSIRN